MKRLLALALALLAGCAAPAGIPLVASARVSPDFPSYPLRRVGLMPVEGDEAGTLQDSLFAELSRSTPYELVLLDARDLAEVQESEPHRRGTYKPRTIIDISRRYRLDGILFGVVLQRQYHPPQRLSLAVDLVSSDTGLVIWSAATHLDAEDPDVRLGIQRWSALGGVSTDAMSVALLSPARFGHFAAWQVARLL